MIININQTTLDSSILNEDTEGISIINSLGILYYIEQYRGNGITKLKKIINTNPFEEVEIYTLPEYVGIYHITSNKDGDIYIYDDEGIKIFRDDVLYKSLPTPDTLSSFEDMYTDATGYNHAYFTRGLSL